MARRSGPRNSEPETKPKPGATHARIKPEHQAGKHEAPAGVQPTETSDPRQVGSGKEVQRELLERNVGDDGAAKGNPNTAAGLHSTGSFTGRKRRAS